MGAWWLFIIGGAAGMVTLCGWIFEYYRGEYAH
ncbi:cytochrome c oxidase subunit 4 [Nocardioides sp.]|nr:cytochrome c oxidase subunit 4 [Nocardioides sp.]MDP3891607.1 cytochrome c oxidase subunit 4 [Nocardioides sp.]